MIEQLEPQKRYSLFRKRDRGWVLTAFVVSTLFHGTLLYLSENISDKSATGSDSPNHPLLIKLTTTTSTKEQISSDPGRLTTKSDSVVDDNVSQENLKQSTILPIAENKTDIVSEPIESADPPRTINYSRLSSTTSQIITEDAKNWQLVNTTRCISPLGYRKQDCGNSVNFEVTEQAMLAKIFDKALGNPESTRMKRMSDRLMQIQSRLSESLISEDMTKELRNQLLNELYQVREQQRIIDCGGQLEQGNCAGEMDVLKVISTIGKLIDKVKAE